MLHYDVKKKHSKCIQLTWKLTRKNIFTVDFCFTESWYPTLFIVTSIAQRHASPEFQPSATNQLYPQHKHLLVKRSQRCKVGRHHAFCVKFYLSRIVFLGIGVEMSREKTNYTRCPEHTGYLNRETTLAPIMILCSTVFQLDMPNVDVMFKWF